LRGTRLILWLSSLLREWLRISPASVFSISTAWSGVLLACAYHKRPPSEARQGFGDSIASILIGVPGHIALYGSLLQ
jgi:hypothetical protein